MATSLLSVLQGTVFVLVASFFSILWGTYVALLLAYKTLTNSKMWQLKSRPHPPPCLEDPVWGQHGYAKGAQGVKIHFVEKGDRSRPLMLFVHGFPESWYSWRHQLIEFSKDYWVVALDMRGYGQSDKPKGVSNYGLDILAEDLKEVVCGFGREKFILIGHDWGSVVAWRFVERYPHMLITYVNMNAPQGSIFFKMIMTEVKQFFMSWYVLLFQLPILPELMLTAGDLKMWDPIFGRKSLSSPTDRAALEELDAFKFMMAKPDAFTPPVNYYRALTRAYARKLFFGEPVYAKLSPESAPPGLYLHGDADKYVSVSCVNHMREYMPNLQTTVIPGAGHFLEHENYIAVNRTLRQFLAEHQTIVTGETSDSVRSRPRSTE